MAVPEVYWRHDLRRLILLLVALVVLPCAALVLLAHQHVRTVRTAAAQQYKDECGTELKALGVEARALLFRRLNDSAAVLRNRAPGQSLPAAVAADDGSAAPFIRTVFLLEAPQPVLYRPTARLPLSDRPDLSVGHPSRTALFEARRAPPEDGARALGLYRQVLEAGQVPSALRTSVVMEMARREAGLGRPEAALQLYEEGWSQGSDLERSDALPSWLHALEVAAAAGLSAKAERWADRAMAEFGRPDRLPREGEPAFVASLLKRWMPPAYASPRLPRLERMSRWLRVLDRLARDHGEGPYHFTAWPGVAFQRALPSLPGRNSTEWPLVDLDNPLPDGHRIGWVLSAEVLAREIAGPTFARFTEARGGKLEWMAADSLPDGGRAAAVEQALPPPLDFMVVRYDMAGSVLFRHLAASRAHYLTWVFGVSVAWLLTGLGAALYRVGHSANLARLQADMLDRVGHELRTPVAAISVLTETLERQDPDLDAETRRRVAGLLRAESGRIQQLVERLMAFARGRRGMRRFALAEGRLDEIARQVAHLFPVESGTGENVLRLNIQTADYAGRFDGQAISQAILNLLDNAVKYCEQAPRIVLDLRRDGPQAVLTVTDNGIGMPSEVLRHIFKPYYRADSSLAASVGGIGVGLSIVRAVVRAHGGRVTVRSTPGQGSVFEIRLPLSEVRGVGA